MKVVLFSVGLIFVQSADFLTPGRTGLVETSMVQSAKRHGFVIEESQRVLQSAAHELVHTAASTVSAIQNDVRDSNKSQARRDSVKDAYDHQNMEEDAYDYQNMDDDPCSKYWDQKFKSTNKDKTLEFKGITARYDSCCFRMVTRKGQCKPATKEGSVDMCRCPDNLGVGVCEFEKELLEKSSDLPKELDDETMPVCSGTQIPLFTVAVIGTTTATYKELIDKLGPLIANKGYHLATGGTSLSQAELGNIGAVREAFHTTKSHAGHVIWTEPPAGWKAGDSKPDFVDDVDTTEAAAESRRVIDRADAIVVLPGGPTVKEEIKMAWMKRKPLMTVLTEDSEEYTDDNGSHPVNEFVKNTFCKYAETFSDVEEFLTMEVGRAPKTVAVIGNPDTKFGDLNEKLGSAIARNGCNLITGGKGSAAGLGAVRAAFYTAKRGNHTLANTVVSIWTPGADDPDEKAENVDKTDRNAENEKKQVDQADLIVALAGGPGVVQEIKMAQSKGKPIIGLLTPDDATDMESNALVKGAFYTQLSTDAELDQISSFLESAAAVVGVDPLTGAVTGGVEDLKTTIADDCMGKWTKFEAKDATKELTFAGKKAAYDKCCFYMVERDGQCKPATKEPANENEPGIKMCRCPPDQETGCAFNDGTLDDSQLPACEGSPFGLPNENDVEKALIPSTNPLKDPCSGFFDQYVSTSNTPVEFQGISASKDKCCFYMETRKGKCMPDYKNPDSVGMCRCPNGSGAGCAFEEQLDETKLPICAVPHLTPSNDPLKDPCSSFWDVYVSTSQTATSLEFEGVSASKDKCCFYTETRDGQCKLDDENADNVRMCRCPNGSGAGCAFEQLDESKLVTCTGVQLTSSTNPLVPIVTSTNPLVPIANSTTSGNTPPVTVTSSTSVSINVG